MQISKEHPEYHSILCIDNEQLVTFFVLDNGKDKYKYTNRSDSILLRSFSTDSRHTRKGYAKECLKLLPQFIKMNYPDISEVVLGVNEKNPAAIQLYENCGFHDTFKKYYSEKSYQKHKGYQKILAMKL